MGTNPRWSVLVLALGGLLSACAGSPAQEPPRIPPLEVAPPPAGDPPPPAPPHWFERQGAGAVPMPGDPAFDPPAREPLADLYLRFDGGIHKEIGLPQREGAGFELDGRLYLPAAPVFSLVGAVRTDVTTHNDRFSWTAGVLGDNGHSQIAVGVDGVYDDETKGHTGSLFGLLSFELWPQHWFGLWTTAELWDDAHTFKRRHGPFVLQVTQSGVEPYVQTSLFYAAGLGPDNRYGELYIAPGVEHHRDRFRISTGYQVSLTDHLDAFVHYHQTAHGDKDWSVFAGIQLHLGRETARPFDFTMPQRIRARQVRSVRTTFYVFDPFDRFD
jgi:hypothetical protein